MLLRVFLVALVILFSGLAVAIEPKGTRANTALDANNYSGPVDSVEYDTPPKLMKGKAPVYPISQLLSDKKGSSIIIYTIGANGRAKDFEIEGTTDEKYANHAIIAIKDWVFRPATKDGVAIDVRVKQEFVYRIR